MKKSLFTKRTLLKILACVFLVILLVSSGLLFINIWERNQADFKGSSSSTIDTSIKHDGKTYIYDEKLETVLIIGLDKFEDSIENNAYNNDQQADFLVLLVIDNNNSSYSALQINRDTMAPVNILGVAGEKIDTETKQIALSHTYGNGKEVSCRNTADSVSALLNNVDIDHYISLTMDAVPIINDAVGGVTLEILDDFSTVDETLIKGETLTLNGTQALTYIRSRYGMDDSSNQSRMARQKQYLNALYEKFSDCVENDGEFVFDVSMNLSEHLVSDHSVNKLQTLFDKLSAYEMTEIRTLKGDVKAGERFAEFYPDEDHLLQSVIDFFYKEKE